MIVVSDTTPMITLMKAQQLSVLHSLFDEVLVPEAVYQELTANHLFQSEIDLIQSSAFLTVVSVQDQNAVMLLRMATGLDRGESEAIVYSDANKADLLLMDEVAGRRVAKKMGLPVAGSIGVLIEAFKRNVLSRDEFRAAIEDIRLSNRHISEKLLDDALSMSD